MLIHSSEYSDPTLIVFFFNDTATTDIYTLSLHDALPISQIRPMLASATRRAYPGSVLRPDLRDRKSTRLNSSHVANSYAVFCFKQKKGSVLDHRGLLNNYADDDVDTLPLMT